MKRSRKYRPALSLVRTEEAIKFIKDRFQLRLGKALRLRRVSAPMVVKSGTGINDDLDGKERPVRFRVRDARVDSEIVQSLAKWKRMALADYGFKRGFGLYTDMNAIRPDEKLDNIHSIYVDQWDWEHSIGKGDRNIAFLKRTVKKIYKVIRETELAACRRYKKLAGPFLPKEISFIHSEDLFRMFPNLSPKQREDAICRRCGAVFIIGIGHPLADGHPHDARAADYDDWSTETFGGRRGLNGDILVWYPVLGSAFELSSMGIRVDRASLVRQCRLKGENEKLKMYFHKRLLCGRLPLSIGGGIGQSRLCMFFLRKRHIGEVQSSVWPERIEKECRTMGIPLL